MSGVYQGDPSFARMLLAQAAALKRYARRLAATAADADDLLQETLLRCWSSRAMFEPGTNFVGWTMTVMRNAFFTSLRRNRFEVDTPDEFIEHRQAVAPSQVSAIDLKDTYRALEHLPEPQRRAVLMASEGVSIEEAAAELDVPTNTYKSWVRRGRSRLVRLLDGDERISPPVSPVRPHRGAPNWAAGPRARSRKSKARGWSGVMIG